MVATGASSSAGALTTAPSGHEVDREKHCPFLVRVFCNVGSHNRREAYERLEETPLTNEHHVYAWPDATLREIADLIQDTNSDARKSGARMGFSIISQETSGRVVMRKAGWVNANRRKTADEDKTLQSMRFQPGDFLDVAILS